MEPIVAVSLRDHEARAECSERAAAALFMLMGSTSLVRLGWQVRLAPRKIACALLGSTRGSGGEQRGMRRYGAVGARECDPVEVTAGACALEPGELDSRRLARA